MTPETSSVLTPAMADATTIANETDVYAISGADPEVLAYAMAKYSRSSLSMRESLAEISTQRAEQFLNTFYFQYGHRSIADLAHVAFAIERLSLLAAISLVDEQRWDGQERSTRYQNFRKSGWFLPEFGSETVLKTRYIQTIKSLFETYEQVSARMLDALKGQIACPAEMKPDAYERTLKARAFDVARYLLPMATNTSLGQIVNARTLEQQVSRLLTSEHAEIRKLGERLRDAASTPSWNVQRAALEQLAREAESYDAGLGARARELLLREVKTAPTLVKYTTPCPYERATREELRQAAAALMNAQQIDAAPVVDLVEAGNGGEALEVELATTLLYGACHYSYRQLQQHVEALDSARRNEITALGTRHRGRHDELLRAFSSGYTFRFDILMDIGGFRDMHRHRRCIQVLQDYTTAHGYDIPEGLAEADLSPLYEETMSAAFATVEAIGRADFAEAKYTAQYALPLGTRCRSLFKMDFAEALYISELRSGQAGHFSYRRVAWEMYQAIEKRYPALAEHFRVTDISEPVDLLKR
jgi:thymidylate synthase ThyX